MKLFAANLLLALTWGALHGELGATTLATGFLVGLAVLFVVSPVVGGERYFRTLGRTPVFFFWYVVDIFRSGFRVARDVLTPGARMHPGFIEYSLEAESDVEIVVLANLVSLTPGSLTVDVSADRHRLLLHSLFVERELGEICKLEERVLRLLRGEPG